MQLGESTVDLTKGIFTICGGEPDLTEKICLGFAVSTLYLLVQPFPDNLDLVEHKWKNR